MYGERFSQVSKSTAASILGCVVILLIFAGSAISAVEQADRLAPGDLSQIVLNISPQQLVGRPLLGSAQIFLLDENSDLIPGYDLASQPLLLSGSVGLLFPDTLNNPDWFTNGVIDFLPAGVAYHGPSGAVEVTASADTITSLGVLVSFSGYDILSATDLLGNQITSIFSGLPTRARIEVANGGEQVAIQDPRLKIFFASGGGSVQLLFRPAANGHVDTLTANLPTSGLTMGSDTLIMVLESVYRLGGTNYPVADTMRLPVEIKSPAQFTLADGSFSPDSVYAGIPFEVSFDVAVTGFSGPVDGGNLTLTLLDAGDTAVATIFSGSISAESFDGGYVRYRHLGAICPAGLAPDRYRIDFEYQLISNGNIFTFTTPPVDSLLILPPVLLSYVDSSFQPTVVASGQETHFTFDLTVSGDETVVVDRAASSFQLLGSGFSTTTPVIVAGDTLAPGGNRIRSEQVSIPTNQVGQALSAGVAIVYRHPGSANALTFTTTFGGQTVHVEELPRIQIVATSVVAVNAPNVNTLQNFRISCAIANLSPSNQPPFDISLSSNGSSTFARDLTVPGVPGEDTVTVFFDLTASAVPNSPEIFWVDVTTVGVNQETPVNRYALANIQEPALLTIGYILLGADQGYVNIGDDFSVIIGIVNSGQAEADSGRFEITAHGQAVGLPEDPYYEVATVGVPRGISFRAPDYDTTVTIDFTLVDRPLDLNTNLPAQIDDTAFQITLAVVTPDVSLLAQTELTGSNVVLPGEAREMFVLRLINPGASSVSDVRLESVSLQFVDPVGRPLEVRSVLETGASGLFDGATRVTAVTAGDDRMNLLFNDNFVVHAGDSVELVFRTRVKAEPGTEFGLVLNSGDIEAAFASGPFAGNPVTVSSIGGVDPVLKETFTSVGPTLKGSFVIKENPFDPSLEAAEFQYFVDQSSQLEFRILTLTGELVYSIDIPEGSAGTQIGLHSLAWDGRNDEGYIVLNGVYVAVLTAVKTGEQATLKVAVLK
jgi:hypothetical protein